MPYEWITKDPGLQLAIQAGLVIAANLGVLYLVARRLRMHRKAPNEQIGHSGRPTFASDETETKAEEVSETEVAEQPETEKPPEEANAPAEEEPFCFVVDSLFLAASFQFVCGAGAGANESFHYVAGVRLGRTVVLNHILPVTFSHQSPGGVRVDDESNVRTLEELDSWGLPLLAHVHSHLMSGPGGTCPSGIDRRFAERLARGGYKIVGLIFSRDGFVRFFAHEDTPFRVEVKGQQVRRIDDYVFKLEMVADGDIPISVYPAGVRRRSGRGRSPGHDSGV